jgi:hypothetical protein
MPTTTLASERHLRPDEKPLADYRDVSRLAVLAAGLGVASAIVLISPFFIPVALATVLVAVLALRSIAAAGGQLVGRAPAVTGLALAAMFLAWGATRHVSRQAALESAARQSAETWLHLVQSGQLEQALQLRLSSEARLSSPEAMKDFYQKNADAGRELQNFTSGAGVKALVAAGPSARVEYGGLQTAIHDGFNDQVQLKFTLFRDPAQGGPLPLWINLFRRQNEKSKRGSWEVQSLDTNPPASAQ